MAKDIADRRPPEKSLTNIPVCGYKYILRKYSLKKFFCFEGLPKASGGRERRDRVWHRNAGAAGDRGDRPAGGRPQKIARDRKGPGKRSLRVPQGARKRQRYDQRDFPERRVEARHGRSQGFPAPWQGRRDPRPPRR